MDMQVTLATRAAIKMVKSETDHGPRITVWRHTTRQIAKSALQCSTDEREDFEGAAQTATRSHRTLSRIGSSWRCCFTCGRRKPE